MSYNFFAYLDRMKYIRRWQLMRSVRDENIMEHSQQVAMFAHALAVINNKVFGGNASADKAVSYAVFHECSEVMTGDLPTPIKYFNNSITGAYKQLEERALDKLIDNLPVELRGEYASSLKPDTDSYEYKIMKAADRLSAYVKCLEELRCGNEEFANAKKSIEEDLKSRKMPEVDYFFKNFIPAFSLTLDELEGM
ncbi:MAG: 5'-deoxynucleotidase [Clostridia bacterium]|nr:5'-deoxynucleotidase [Clostridia bacterium]